MNQVSEGQVQINKHEAIGGNVTNEDYTFSDWANLSSNEKTTNKALTNENEQKFSEWAKPSDATYDTSTQKIPS